VAKVHDSYDDDDDDDINFRVNVVKCVRYGNHYINQQKTNIKQIRKCPQSVRRLQRSLSYISVL